MNQAHSSPRSSQAGATLIFALLTLIALMLSTLALVRSVDISTLVMGNLGFKQDATAAADQATRHAISWLSSNLASLNNHRATDGYYASVVETSATDILDVTGTQAPNVSTRELIDWDDDRCASATPSSFAKCEIKPEPIATDINGNTSSYVIFRMCSAEGDISVGNTIQCARPLNATGNSSLVKGDLNYADHARFTSAASPYYRIVVRVLGARNTVSFTETIVHF